MKHAAVKLRKLNRTAQRAKFILATDRFFSALPCALRADSKINTDLDEMHPVRLKLIGLECALSGFCKNTALKFHPSFSSNWQANEVKFKFSTVNPKLL